MDEMLPAISASDQRRLVAAYGGSTSFQYEPYVMHLRRLVERFESLQLPVTVYNAQYGMPSRAPEIERRSVCAL